MHRNPHNSLVHATATVLLVHTGHDAEHHGPANQGRENSARCIETMNMLLQLSSWSISAKMTSILGLPTREENTAKGALSPSSRSACPPRQPLPPLLFLPEEDDERGGRPDQRRQASYASSGLACASRTPPPPSHGTPWAAHKPPESMS